MPKVEKELKLDFKDVLIRPKRTLIKSRAEIDLECEYHFRNSKRTYKSIPIMAANMDSVGTLDTVRSLVKHRLFTCVCKHVAVDEWVQLRDEFGDAGDDIWSNVAVTTALHGQDFNNAKRVIDAVPQPQFICLDVANGYMESFVDFVRKAREEWPRHILMAGNVGTPEMAEELLLTGADIIKVGIGGGSVCTTRKIAGVGYPQLSSVLECCEIAHEIGGHILSDGGCTCPGDVAKAFGAGADFVMLGGMLAGHDQTSGPIIEKNGKKYKLFYGMSSKTSMEKYAGEVASHRASEGRTIEIPYRGDIAQAIQDILGGIRSACSYTGTKRLQELRDVTTFVRVTQQTNDLFASVAACDGFLGG